ncbi:MAG TPA: hypothetical protein VF637_18480 [Sphingomicrobium sp.]
MSKLPESQLEKRNRLGCYLIAIAVLAVVALFIGLSGFTSGDKQQSNEAMSQQFGSAT